MNEEETLILREKVVQALRTCFDPEIPVNIYDLGLIYDLKVKPSGEAYIKMTLTAPNCPVAGVLPRQVEQTARSVTGITDVHLELVWEPAWDRNMMSDAAKLQLGFDLGFDVVPLDRLKL
jgi:FeS assembly SUF system protein